MNANSDILNISLSFSMEFGEDWLKPINQRVASLYPNLTEEQLCEYDLLCKKVNEKAHEFVRRSFGTQTNKTENEDIELVDFETFNTFIFEKYSWVNQENSRRLYSQSCYYAWK